MAARADNHRQRGRLAELGGVHLLGELEQAGSSIFHRLARAQFDFKSDPTTGVCFNDSIHFHPGVIPVLEHMGVVGLGIDPQVAQDQSFEKEAEKLKIVT